ncbi:unnamed protein product [Heligmosomoides polygyrus]|uniref:Uncharacterized protein n=1 Tax=Heligmosomoides polygyrus TaxID=6339 RepID=A0A3P7XJG6_HELPZ|nr:unnamed protein product [Heligmosomoides polygyrus]
MISNLGTKLFQSVTDRAGDLGEKFEEEFSRLSFNITAEIDALVTEVISLSGYVKVTLVILSILLILAIIRLTSYGFRCLAFRAKTWFQTDENKPPPQVILLMPTGDGSYRPSSTVYADPQTKSVIDRIQRDSFDLFNDYSVPAPVPPPPRKKPPMLAAMKENV